MKSNLKNLSLAFAFVLMAGASQAQNKVPTAPKCQKGKVSQCSSKKTCSKKAYGIRNLSEEQRAVIEKEHKDLMKETLPLKSKLNVLEAELRNLHISDRVSQSSINSKIDQISRTKASIKKLRAASKQKIRKALTDEQRVKFDSRILKGDDNHFAKKTCSSKKKACSPKSCQ